MFLEVGVYIMNGESILNHKANMYVIVLVLAFLNERVLSFLSQIMAWLGKRSINHTILRLLCSVCMRCGRVSMGKDCWAGSGKCCECIGMRDGWLDCLCYIQNKRFLISCVLFLTKRNFNA